MNKSRKDQLRVNGWFTGRRGNDAYDQIAEGTEERKIYLTAYKRGLVKFHRARQVTLTKATS